MIIPRSGRLALFPVVLMALVACRATAPDWQAPRLRDHPLVGTIHAVEADGPVSPHRLSRRLSDADIVLLGEKHDNPDHHRQRLALLDRLLEKGAVSVVAMEMMTVGQSGRIENLDPELTGADARLHEALDWENGWHWPFYRPVLHRVLARPGVALRPANIDTASIMRIYRGDGGDGVPGRLNETRMARLHEDIRESHCDRLPDDQIPAMVRIQQARDLRMARSLAPADRDGARILLAGNYHLRRDVGVPAYIEGGEDMISVAFLEVRDGVTDPASYLPRSEAGQVPAWDYIWFTPATPREDPCA